MLVNYSNISFFLIISSIILFLGSCANPQPPTGGPPDTTPPVITEYYPENKTTNFSDRLVKLRFNKYMDKSKVLENFSISPNVPVTFDWSGKVLEIELPEDLDTSITYSISLGTEYSDLYNNKPETAFSLIFSAGDKIDSGFVSGKVYDNSPQGAYIYCYSLDNINPDTLNPSKTQPDYRVQLGTNGEFRITALKDGKYRIFSIKDQFKNFLYDPSDNYSSSLTDLVVKGAKSEPTILKLGPPIDNMGPSLIDATSEYSNRISLKFSERIDPNFVSSKSFELFTLDSIKNSIIATWIHWENKSKVELLTKESLDTNKTWIIKAITGKEYAIRDTIGNLIIDSLNTMRFKASAITDTGKITLLYTPLKDSAEYIKVSPKLDFIFDRALDTTNSSINISIKNAESKEKVDTEIIINSSEISVLTKKELKDNTWYIIEAKLKNIKSANNENSIDSNITMHFKTVDYKTKGSISGKVQFDVDICDFSKILILKSKGGKDIYYKELGNNNEWSFKNIETGEYTAELFCDVDGDGKYSFGTPYPFTYSEPFVVFEDVLKIKPRWELENIILNVKNSHAH